MLSANSVVPDHCYAERDESVQQVQSLPKNLRRVAAPGKNGGASEERDGLGIFTLRETNSADAIQGISLHRSIAQILMRF